VNPHEKILLLGSNEEAGLEICRSLGGAGYAVTILRFSLTATPADRSRWCAKSVYIGSPDCGVRVYVEKLSAFLSSNRHTYLIPVDDIAYEIVYSDYDAISQFTQVVGPCSSSYAIAHNRCRATAVAKAAGLIIPELRIVNRGSSALDPPLPCIVRPLFSSAVIDDEPQIFSTREVNTAEQLDAKLRDDTPRTDVILAAPAPGSPIELSFCSIGGNVLAATVTLSVHMKGNAASYRKNEEVTPEILSIIKRIAQGLNWTGFMTIKCRREKDYLYFNELEPWPSASISTSVCAGVDFPKLLVEGLQRRFRQPVIAACPVYVRHLRMDMAWLMHQSKRERLKVVLLWLSSFGRLLIGRERFAVERFTDPKPGLQQLGTFVKTRVANMRLRLSLAVRPSLYRLDPEGLLKTSSILIVCKGNINRSVVAECLLKRRGFSAVASAGLLRMSGRRLSRFAEMFLAERGINASEFRSRSITKALKEKQDIDFVVCFEAEHALEIVQRFPSFTGRVFLFSRMTRGGESSHEIADPHGGTSETYAACFERIERIVNRLAPNVGGNENSLVTVQGN
jgi:protein-tyrosine-phosphatase